MAVAETDYYMEFDAPVTHNRYLITDSLIALESEAFLENQSAFDLKHCYFDVDTNCDITQKEGIIRLEECESFDCAHSIEII